MSDPLLQTYAGLLIVGSIRGFFLLKHRRRYERVTSSPDDSERQSLLGRPSLVHEAERGSLLKGKIICIFVAVCYIIATIYMAGEAMQEYQGPILDDPRFMYGRGAMLAGGLTLICRLTFQERRTLSGKGRADSIALITIPFVMELFHTPSAHFPGRALFDLVLIPGLGVICFLGSWVYHG